MTSKKNAVVEQVAAQILAAGTNGQYQSARHTAEGNVSNKLFTIKTAPSGVQYTWLNICESRKVGTDAQNRPIYDQQWVSAMVFEPHLKTIMQFVKRGHRITLEIEGDFMLESFKDSQGHEREQVVLRGILKDFRFGNNPRNIQDLIKEIAGQNHDVLPAQDGESYTDYIVRLNAAIKTAAVAA